MLCSAPGGLTRRPSRGTELLSSRSVTSSSILPPLLSVSPHLLFFLHPALFTAPVSSSPSGPCGPDVWGVFTSDPRPRALSVIAVRPELDSLYRKMNEQNGGEGPGTVCDQPRLKISLLHTSRFHLGAECVAHCLTVVCVFVFVCITQTFRPPMARLASRSRPKPMVSTTSPTTASFPIMPFSSTNWAASPSH